MWVEEVVVFGVFVVFVKEEVKLVIGFKRGSVVKVLRCEFYWFNDIGKVVVVD